MIPLGHRQAIHICSLFKSLILEERRNVKLNSNAIGERAVFKLMFAPHTTRAAETCTAS